MDVFFSKMIFFSFLLLFGGGGRLRICMIQCGRYSCSKRLSPQSKIFRSDVWRVIGGRGK